MGVDVQRIEPAATTTAQDERPDDNPPDATPIPEISRQPARRRTVDGDELSMRFDNPRRRSTFSIVAPGRYVRVASTSRTAAAGSRASIARYLAVSINRPPPPPLVTLEWALKTGRTRSRQGERRPAQGRRTYVRSELLKR